MPIGKKRAIQAVLPDNLVYQKLVQCSSSVLPLISMVWDT